MSRILCIYFSYLNSGIRLSCKTFPNSKHQGKRTKVKNSEAQLKLIFLPLRWSNSPGYGVRKLS